MVFPLVASPLFVHPHFHMETLFVVENLYVVTEMALTEEIGNQRCPCFSYICSHTHQTSSESITVCFTPRIQNLAIMSLTTPFWPT